MSDKPLGIDISQHQGKMNWDIVAAHHPKVEFVGIRSGISWGYTDKWFSFNWAEAKRVGIPRTAYHVIYPASSANRQVDKIIELLGGDNGELPITLDIELDHGQHFSKIAAKTYQCAVLLENKTGKKPIIYSRANWVDLHITGTGNVPNWLNDYDYWLAQYLREPREHPGPPTLPKGVSRNRVIIHQTSERGAPIGSQAKMQDYNRWQGDLASFYNYIGKTTPLDEPPPEPLTLEERIQRLEGAARQNGWQI